MNQKQIKKLAVSAMFTALAVCLSPFYIPIGVSKCFPIQHMVNILGAVFLGPAYSVGVAFCTSLIRNLMGTGSPLAFPGSMAGAWCSAFLYQRFQKKGFAFAGEVAGTGVLGALLAYPTARFFMGKEAAVFAFVLPFLISTLGGSILGILLVAVFEKTGLLGYMHLQMGNKT